LQVLSCASSPIGYTPLVGLALSHVFSRSGSRTGIFCGVATRFAGCALGVGRQSGCLGVCHNIKASKQSESQSMQVEKSILPCHLTFFMERK
jgi:hypothetical protein